MLGGDGVTVVVGSVVVVVVIRVVGSVVVVVVIGVVGSLVVVVVIGVVVGSGTSSEQPQKHTM